MLRPHPADAAVPLEAVHPAPPFVKAMNLSSSSGLPVTNVTFISERARRDRGRLEQLALVEVAVELAGLLLVPLLHRGKAAGALDPLEDQAHDVDREGRRRVVAGVVLGVRPVLEHRRDVDRPAFTRSSRMMTRVTPAGAEVLLGSGVNQAVLRDVDRPAEHVAAGVADQRGVARRGRLGS